jgi:hypothetical protein
VASTKSKKSSGNTAVAEVPDPVQIVTPSPLPQRQGPLLSYLARIHDRHVELSERNADFLTDLRTRAPKFLLRLCAAVLLAVVLVLPGMAMPVLCFMVATGILAQPLLNIGGYILVACSLRPDR